MHSSAPSSSRVTIGLVLLAVGVTVACLGLRSIWTVDYWWQWKTGAWVAEHGVPRTDVFSYTNAGVPRLELRWAWCLAVFQLSEALGHGAVVVFKTLLVLLTFGLAASLAPWRRAPVLTGATVVVAALASSQRFFARPEVLSVLLLIATVAVVDASRRGRRRAWLALVPLQILWVNTHGLFLLGPAVVGAWLVGDLVDSLRTPAAAPSASGSGGDDERPRPKLAALALTASLLSCLANPYGWEAVRLPLLQFGALHGTSQKGFFLELSSPFSFETDWTALRWYRVLLGAVLVALLADLRRQPTFWLLLVGSQLYLSVTAIRNLPLFSVVAVPYVVRHLSASPWAARAGSRLPSGGGRVSLRHVALAALLVFCGWQTWRVVTNRFYVEQGDTNRFGVGVAEHKYPEAAADVLDASGLRGPLFQSPGIGSYLIARGYPVFIDPRGEQHGAGVIEQYRSILDAPGEFARWTGQYDFRVAVLPVEMRELARVLDADDAWRLVHADEVAVVYLRDDGEAPVPTLVLEGEAGRRWAETATARLGQPPEPGPFTRVAIPAPWLRLAELCLERKLHEHALINFQRARAAWPDGFTDHELLGHAAAGAGDMALATEAFARAAVDAPDDPVAQRRAAVGLLNAGRWQAALVPVERMLQRDPADPEAQGLRGLVAMAAGRPDEAAGWLRAAAEADPTSSTWLRHLGAAMAVQGQGEQARAALEQAWERDDGDGAVARDLARLLAASDPEAARTWLARAERLLPRDPVVVELRNRLGGS